MRCSRLRFAVVFLDKEYDASCHLTHPLADEEKAVEQDGHADGQQGPTHHQDEGGQEEDLRTTGTLSLCRQTAAPCPDFQPIIVQCPFSAATIQAVNTNVNLRFPLSHGPSIDFGASCARAHVSEVDAPLGAVRGKRVDPRVPRHHLEEGDEGLVELGKVVGRVEVGHADDGVCAPSARHVSTGERRGEKGGSHARRQLRGSGSSGPRISR